MRKLLRLMTAMFIVSTILYSCKDDDDDATKNYFKVDDEEYDLNWGLLANYGLEDRDEGYFYDLALLSSNFSIDENYDITGQGNGVEFGFYSSSSTELEEGEYTYDYESEEVGTYEFGVYVINLNVEEETTDDAAMIISGTVNVDKDGDTYTITINCTSYTGESITGYYKGTVNYYDWSDDEETLTVSTTKSKKTRKCIFKKVE